MNIALILDKPETRSHPVIAQALQQLSVAHTIRLLDVQGQTGEQAVERESRQTLSDLYLLKSHAPQALALAFALEQWGAYVLNSWAASRACQDRTEMARRMLEARLPWPQAWNASTLGQAVNDQALAAALPFPLIVKSAYSHQNDLVAKADNREALQQLLPRWGEEPVILQEFLPGDGWDQKFWVIGTRVFAARRRTPLEASAPKEDVPLAPEAIPAEWKQMVLDVGRVFGLRLYGVDLLQTERGPLVIDVNAFPGFRGVPEAAEVLAAFVEQLGLERLAKQ
jgi:ribosomal protein S6--L-glutamate ligase